MRNKDKPWFDDLCRHAFSLKQEAHLRRTRDRSRVNWEEFVRCLSVVVDRRSLPMKPTQRPSVSLVIETGMFLRTFSPLISGGPLLSLRCSARVHHCLRSLVRVVEWCVSRLVRLICCRIILTACSPGRLLASDLPLTCHPSPRLTTFAFRSIEMRRLLLDLDPYGGTDPLGTFPLFPKRTVDVMAPVLV